MINFVTMCRWLLIIMVLLFFHEQTFPQQSLRGRFGFGLGYQSNIEFINFDKVNNIFLNTNEQKLGSRLHSNGFTSYLYFLILPDTRVVLNFMKGEMEVHSSQNKFLRFEKSYWNTGLEYTFSVWKLNLSLGFSLGKCDELINLTYFDGNFDFNNLINQLNLQNITSYSLSFKNSTYLLSPVINLEYSLSRFIATRLSYSYNLSLNEKWKFLDKYQLVNQPNDFIENSHTFSAGILFGFMSK